MQSESTTDSFDSFLEWIYLNRVKLGIGTAIVVLVVSGVALFKWKKGQNEVDANAALFALPSTLESAGKPSAAQPQDYQKIAGNYPDTKAAQDAELLAAGILFSEGKYPESQMAFAKFVEKYDDKQLQAEAALGVAASMEAQNKIADAIPKYQELISKYPNENVISPAKLTLARFFESQNKPSEALKYYDDLRRSNNPYDPWAAEAGERREQLLEKYPELRPKPVMASSNGLPAGINFSAPSLLPPTNHATTNK